VTHIQRNVHFLLPKIVRRVFEPPAFQDGFMRITITEFESRAVELACFTAKQNFDLQPPQKISFGAGHSERETKYTPEVESL
jgi:hypothetical protein